MTEFKTDVKNLFLIDAIGALVSAFFLGFVLVWLKDKIGMPTKVLYALAMLSILFTFYSLGCYFFLKSNWKPYLMAIAILNLLYCLLTISILIFYNHKLTFLGWSYFIVELFILFVLIRIEFKTSTKGSIK